MTLHTDERVLEKARLCAEERHTTVDQLFQAALELVADKPGSAAWETARERLRDASPDEPEGSWTRAERNHRLSKMLDEFERRDEQAENGNLFLRAARKAGSFYVERPLTRADMKER